MREMQKITKVIIAGGRDFDDYNYLCAICDLYLSDYDSIEIVSGTARGADSLGEKYACAKGYSIQRFPADWNTWGKRTGYIRNSQMATYSDVLIAFWDGKSRGTKNMIDIAQRLGLKVIILPY